MKRLPTCRARSTTDAPVDGGWHGGSRATEYSEGVGEVEREEPYKGKSCISSSDVVGLGRVGEGGWALIPDAGSANKPRSRYHLPFFCVQRGMRTSYPPMRAKFRGFLFGERTKRKRPATRTTNPIHMRPLPHVPRKPMKAASSACQLLP